MLKPGQPSPKLNQKKRTFISSAATATAILALSGCVVSSEPPSTEGDRSNPNPSSTPSPSNSENESSPSVLASSLTSSTAVGGDYQIDIYTLEKVGNGIARLRLGVKNNSDSSYFFDNGLGDAYTASRVTLLDPQNRTRHLSLRQNDGTCFCSTLEEDIPSGESAELIVHFPEPPDGVTTMTVTTPLTPPIFDVPVTESSESVENSGLADPEIIPLTMISDNVEDNTGRTESGDEVSIILSSDVLFETNSSDLSPDAQEILEQVASEIDDASSESVNVDGYADNTGSDSVNIPLSEERAAAVEDTLSNLISREVDFEVQGHGSSDPIGDNDTEEGRERNRRVSVTFEK